VQRLPDRAQVLVNHFADDWWRETLVFSLSLPKPVIFTDFMKRFLPHPHNADGFPVLLGQLVQEARRKPVEAFEKFLPNGGYQWQKRYNALECLRLIGSGPAKALVKQVWEKEKKVQVKTKARELLELWKLREPPAEPEILTGLASSWRNPYERDTEYILIPGGRYNFSLTVETVEVSAIYFAKYPATNKLYRRFIDSLAGRDDQQLSARLPMERYSEALTNAADEVKGFNDYMGEERTEWAGKLQSKYHDNRRFNGDDQPVIGVTWFARRGLYCRWLTELENTSQEQSERFIYRLPSEMEWEWVASGGEREYPWGREKPVENRANYGQNVGQTTPVGAYPAGATPGGLMDMAGNVWEWMENWYDKEQDYRTLLGGSWSNYAGSLRCAARYRYRYGPGRNWDSGGFRVVRCQS
jgi:formylglycine-generating enzyme required for sulfatase activity